MCTSVALTLVKVQLYFKFIFKILGFSDFRGVENSKLRLLTIFGIGWFGYVHLIKDFRLVF